jgi:hypothetical protein
MVLNKTQTINQRFGNTDIYSNDEIDPSTTFFCSQCGKKNKFHHEYCYFCGENLNEAKEVIKQKLLLIELNESDIILCPNCEGIIENDTLFCEICGVDIKKKSRYIPKAFKKIVWLRDEGKCVECGNAENLEYDHIIPFSKGGANTVRNIQILCSKCNKKKSNKING